MMANCGCAVLQATLGRFSCRVGSWLVQMLVRAAHLAKIPIVPLKKPASDLYFPISTAATTRHLEESQATTVKMLIPKADRKLIHEVSWCFCVLLGGIGLGLESDITGNDLQRTTKCHPTPAPIEQRCNKAGLYHERM